MSQKTFKRDEIKYLLTREQYSDLLPCLERNIEYDSFCKNGKPYLVKSIYMDTPTNIVIKKSIAKPKYKVKMRIRQYGSNGRLFLELKKKISGVVYKRRIEVSRSELDEFVSKKKLPIRESYLEQMIIREIEEFLRQYPDVTPSVVIDYERIAFVGSNKTLRITIDSNLGANSEEVSLETDSLSDIVPKNKHVMEIKTISGLPLWLTNTLSELKIYPHSFSKYGTEYKNRIKELQHV